MLVATYYIVRFVGGVTRYLGTSGEFGDKASAAVIDSYEDASVTAAEYGGFYCYAGIRSSSDATRNNG